MSAEEAALLAAECPVPDTLPKARSLISMFRRECLYFKFDTDQRVPELMLMGEMQEMFKRLWSIASIFQREAILIAWAKEVLS